MLDKTVFGQMMTMLCEVYQVSLTKSLSSTYYFLLQDMQDEDFKQAVKNMMMERTYATLPKPAEILERSKIKKEAIVEIDETELKAKEMIQACEAMNTILFDEAQKRGLFFEEYVKDYEFKNISPESKAILNNVKPYCEYKRLIINIRQYQTSKDAIQAFKSAIKQSENGSIGINYKIKKMIGN